MQSAREAEEGNAGLQSEIWEDVEKVPTLESSRNGSDTICTNVLVELPPVKPRRSARALVVSEQNAEHEEGHSDDDVVRVQKWLFSLESASVPALVVLWYTTSLLTTSLNKVIFGSFKFIFPVFVTFFHVTCIGWLLRGYRALEKRNFLTKWKATAGVQKNTGLCYSGCKRRVKGPNCHTHKAHLAKPVVAYEEETENFSLSAAAATLSQRNSAALSLNSTAAPSCNSSAVASPCSSAATSPGSTATPSLEQVLFTSRSLLPKALPTVASSRREGGAQVDGTTPPVQATAVGEFLWRWVTYYLDDMSVRQAIVPMAAATVADIVLTNYSYNLISLSCLTVIKSTAVLFTYLLSVFAFRLEPFRCELFAVCFGILVGVASAVSGMVVYSSWGILTAFSAAFLSSARWVVLHKSLHFKLFQWKQLYGSQESHHRCSESRRKYLLDALQAAVARDPHA